jgi:hypothetical protein
MVAAGSMCGRIVVGVTAGTTAMSTQFSQPQLDQLRRDAKRLSRSLSITHSEALDRIAAQHSFKNWSLLAKHSAGGVAGPAPSPSASPRVAAPVLARPPADPRKRYYLHGDQYEEDAFRYYCAECDVFFKADHFASHGMHTSERFLSAEERWAKRDAQSKQTWRRPDKPVNVLRAPALAARAQYQALRPAFSDWLLTQGRRFYEGERRDNIGLMARSLVRARGLPTTPKSLTLLRQHYQRRGEHRHQLEALEAAWAEFLEVQAAKP